MYIWKVAPKSVTLQRKVAPKSVMISKKVAPKSVIIDYNKGFIMNIFVAMVSSPFGWLRLEAEGDALVGCTWIDEPTFDENCAVMQGEDNVEPECITAARRQLDEYFRGERRAFDLPLKPCGTDFQKSVWHQLALIPYATTLSYSTLARLVGRPKAARAVAQACHRNPLAVIIPCHRVIGANGSLTGYAAGLERKQGLLNIENSRLL